MSERGGRTKNELIDLFGGRPGWRLEARSTPGATPLWCFVVAGKIEFSVTRDQDAIHLYIMETDREIVFKDADELTAWLRSNRAEAMQEPTAGAVPGKSRFRKLFEWS